MEFAGIPDSPDVGYRPERRVTGMRIVRRLLIRRWLRLIGLRRRVTGMRIVRRLLIRRWLRLIGLRRRIDKPDETAIRNVNIPS